MRALAFLQNTWVRDVPRCEAVLAELTPQRRRSVQEAWLFMGCLSGRRLERAFGDSARDGSITWDNASPRLGGASCAVFPPDFAHIGLSLDDVRPTVVLTFGKVALAGVRPLWEGPLISGPHPAARGGSVVGELARMAAELRAMGAL